MQRYIWNSSRCKQGNLHSSEFSTDRIFIFVSAVPCNAVYSRRLTGKELTPPPKKNNKKKNNLSSLTKASQWRFQRPWLQGSQQQQTKKEDTNVLDTDNPRQNIIFVLTSMIFTVKEKKLKLKYALKTFLEATWWIVFCQHTNCTYVHADKLSLSHTNTHKNKFRLYALHSLSDI